MCINGLWAMVLGAWPWWSLREGLVWAKSGWVTSIGASASQCFRARSIRPWRCLSTNHPNRASMRTMTCQILGTGAFVGDKRTAARANSVSLTAYRQGGVFGGAECYGARGSTRSDGSCDACRPIVLSPLLPAHPSCPVLPIARSPPQSRPSAAGCVIVLLPQTPPPKPPPTLPPFPTCHLPEPLPALVLLLLLTDLRWSRDRGNTRKA